MDEGKVLYEAFLAGSKEAFEELVIKFSEPLLLFINSYVRDYHLAEDLMEDCFVDLLLKKPKFDGRARFKSFLFQIGKFKALNHLRRARLFFWQSTDDEERPLQLHEEASALRELIRDEAERTLYRAIDALPDNYRQALHLVYFEDLSYEEAAAVMGKSKKQIDNYVYRAKKKLADELDKEGAGDEI